MEKDWEARFGPSEKSRDLRPMRTSAGAVASIYSIAFALGMLLLYTHEGLVGFAFLVVALFALPASFLIWLAEMSFLSVDLTSQTTLVWLAAVCGTINALLVYALAYNFLKYRKKRD